MVLRSIKRLPSKVVESFEGLSSSTIYESIPRTVESVMDASIKPIGSEMRLLGSALTVQSLPADNITVHKAMTLAQPGDVLVVSAYGMIGVMWGAQMTYQAIKQGIAGIVVDGSVRDTYEIRKMGFPCFAKMTSPIGSTKEFPGYINFSIVCGGVKVNPGDIVVGDDDGVVVVPQELATEVQEKAKEREARESDARRQMDEGKTSFEIYNFDKVFREKGVQES
ncbi:MAG: hypothetical protein ABSG55_11145 [Dehalococcoidia bacterium]|jgi:4-hydroxy-4-methyl-2-oxoglutarate aldolase